MYLLNFICSPCFVLFFIEKSSRYAKELVDILSEAKQDIPPQLQVMASNKSYGGSSSGKYNSGKSFGGGGGGGGGGRY